MRQTFEDHIEKIRTYEGDLAKDLRNFTTKGLRQIKSKLDKMSEELEIILAEHDERPKGENELYTVKEAAKHLGVSAQTLYNDIACKPPKIKVQKRGRNIRIPASEVNKYFSFISTLKVTCHIGISSRLRGDIDPGLNLKDGVLYELLYTGNMIVVLFDKAENKKVIITPSEYKMNFREATEVEIDADKYNI